MNGNEIQEIIDKFILPTDFADLPPRVQAGIRCCIKVAASMEATPLEQPSTMSPVAKAIANDAIAFEATLADGVDKTRVSSNSYSWGWRYKSDALQLEFRTYCQTQATK